MNQFEDFWKAWLGAAAQSIAPSGTSAPKAAVATSSDTMTRLAEQMTASQRQFMTAFMGPLASQPAAAAQTNVFAPFQAMVEAWMPASGAGGAGKGYAETAKQWTELAGKFSQSGGSPWRAVMKPWSDAVSQIAAQTPAATSAYGAADAAKALVPQAALSATPQLLERLDAAFKMIDELRREVRQLREEGKERKPAARRPASKRKGRK